MMEMTSLEAQEDEDLKAEVDSLLFLEQQIQDEFSIPPSPTTPIWLRILLLVGLIITAIGQAIFSRASLESSSAVIFLIPVQFGVLSLGGLVWSIVGRGGNRNFVRGDGNSNKRLGFVALLSVGSSLLGVWQVTWLARSTWSAIEIFLLPLLILVGPLASIENSSNESAPYYVAISSAFMAGFALLNVPSPGIGVLIALARLPMEGLRWSLMAKGLHGDGPAGFLTSTSTLSFIISIIAVAINFFLHKSDHSLVGVDIGILVKFTISSIIFQFFLFTCFMVFSSTLTPSTSILIRNSVLILMNRGTRSGRQSNGSWVQMFFVCLMGGLGMLWTDGEVNTIASIGKFRGERRRRESSSEEGLLEARKSHGGTLKAGRVPYRLALLPFLPLLIYLLLPATASTSSSFFTACSYLPPAVANKLCYSLGRGDEASTVDLVFSYFEEDLDKFKWHIKNVKETEFVRVRRNRVLIYNKGRKLDKELRETLELNKNDEIINLENIGREGATYLHHILYHYNSTISAITDSATNRPSLKTTVLADHTYFLQPHLAWSWIAQGRLEQVGPDTGFAHFGPYVKSDCGLDVKSDANFEFVKDIFEIFTGEICAPGGQLSAWSGQFVVSKLRILSNEYHRYQALNDLLEAPAEHWIHQKVWTPNDSGGPSNPGFGHYVERAWPVIFGCKDPKMADQCGEEIFEKVLCQCLD